MSSERTARLGRSRLDGGVDQRMLRFVIAAGLFAIPVLTAWFHDFHRFYITTPDSDIVFLYEALRLNAGLPQSLADHPGYTQYVLLAWWLKLMQAVGAIDIVALNMLPALDDPTFEVAYAQGIYVGRYFVAIFSGAFAVAFFEGMRYLTGSLQAAAGSALLFASSAGLATQAVTLVPELLSAFFWFLAFLSLIAATRSDGLSAAARLLASGFFAVLALLAKVQVVALLLALPVLALLFGPVRTLRLPARVPADRAVIFSSIGVALILPAIIVDSYSIRAWEGSGFYQAATAAFVIGAMVAYGVVHRIGRNDWIVGAIALGCGIALGHYAAMIYPNVKVIDALANFMDYLYAFGAIDPQGAPGGGVSWTLVVSRLVSGIGGTLAARFVNVDLLGAPVAALSWLVAGAAVLIAWRGEVRTALQIGALFGLSVAAEIAFRLYQLPLKVLIYLDLPLLIAAALALERMLPIPWRWSKQVCLASVVVLGLIQGRNLADDRLLNRQPAEMACGLAKAYMHEIVDAFARYCRQETSIGSNSGRNSSK